MPGYPHDWIGIAPKGAAPNKYVQFNYTGGARSNTMQFTNLDVGTWVARAYFNDGYVIQAESPPFTVQ